MEKPLTVTQLKRTVKVGDVWTLTYADVPNHKYLNVPREVKVIQSNSIAFTLVGDPTSRKSWLDWPSAANFEAIENGFRIYDDCNQQHKRLLILEYRFGTCENEGNTTVESLSELVNGNIKSQADT